MGVAPFNVAMNLFHTSRSLNKLPPIQGKKVSSVLSILQSADSFLREKRKMARKTPAIVHSGADTGGCVILRSWVTWGWLLCDTNIWRVSNQNGVSLLYIMLEIHHSGPEPSTCNCLAFMMPLSSF